MSSVQRQLAVIQQELGALRREVGRSDRAADAESEQPQQSVPGPLN
jgi:hypothetical protein